MLKRVASLVKTKAIPMQKSAKLEYLAEPSDFLGMLRKLIHTSSDSITMSALYLGSGPLELNLIQDLMNALNDRKRPNLKVTIILDHSRAQRGGEKSSINILKPLVNQHKDRVNILLYQMPQLRNYLTNNLPTELKEVLGVYHCKFNVFDNHVILTGANLSHEYFTSRQDRYMLIRNDSPAQLNGVQNVATYLRDFTSIIAAHCHKLSLGGVIIEPTTPVNTLAHELRELNSVKTGTDSAFAAADSGTLSSRCVDADCNTVFHPIIQHSVVNIHEERNALISLISAANRLSADSKEKSAVSTAVDGAGRSISDSTTATEAGAASATGTITSTATATAEIRISTPYTSFKSSLMYALIHAKSEGHTVVSIINPSANAHGFAGGSGVKALVPKLHQCAFELAIADSNSYVLQSRARRQQLMQVRQTQQTQQAREQLTCDDDEEEVDADDVNSTESISGIDKANTLLHVFIHWLVSGFVRNLNYFFLPTPTTATACHNKRTHQPNTPTAGDTGTAETVIDKCNYVNLGGDGGGANSVAARGARDVVADGPAAVVDIADIDHTVLCGIPTIHEFDRAGWTFHTKGMWFYPPSAAAAAPPAAAAAAISSSSFSPPSVSTPGAAEAAHNTEGTEASSPTPDSTRLPYMTYIGSSNFGSRSWTRDFELGFVLASSDVTVQTLLCDEYNNVEQWCSLHKNKQQQKGQQKGQKQDQGESSSSMSGADIVADLTEKAAATIKQPTAVNGFALTASDRVWLPTVARIIKSFL